MKTSHISVAAATVAAVVLWVSPGPIAGQAPATKGKAQTKAAPAAAKGGLPRTPDGKADLQGIWQAWNTAQYGLEAHSAATGIHAGKTFVVDPADGMIPYLPAARAKQQQNLAKRERLDPSSHCFITGAPRFVYSGFPFQVFQTPQYIQLLSEYAHMVRTIYMGKQTHYDGIDFWNGDSRGHWDGDTLVVDVDNNNDMTWFDASGNHHSDKLKVVERFTRTGPDTLMYQATMTDPETFSRPWTIRMDLHRDTSQYAELLEYECNSYSEDDVARLGK